MRDFLNKYEKLIGWFAGIGLPVSIILSSWLITTSLERSKTDSEYVKIALNILSAPNDHDSFLPEDKKALREWAVRLLDEKSPVKFTLIEQKAFLENNIDVSRGFTDVGLGANFVDADAGVKRIKLKK